MRIDGWETRLAAVIEAAQNKPYVLGENDCLRLACASVEALTGVGLWPRFAGYKTKRHALVTIAKVAPSLGEAVTATLGVSPAPTFSAQRGDLVLFKDEAGEHIGVCLGGSVAVLGPAGLLPLPITAPGLGSCWRVG